MNRYVVIRGLAEYLNSQTTTPEVGNWYVVDLTGGYIAADCGDVKTRADKVAQALNALDGGPL